MAWIYRQIDGWLISPAGMNLAQGYAGAGDGKNNPEMQEVIDVGPLPCGTYTMQEPIDSAELGPYAIPLIPDPSNEMFGRDDFFCHGDSITNPGKASKGCPVMPLFARQRM